MKKNINLWIVFLSLFIFLTKWYYPFHNFDEDIDTIDKDGKEIYLKDIWPSNQEIEETLKSSLNAEMFIKRYSNVSKGPKLHDRF